MFCYQCEQTAGGKGCTKVGICGKNPQTAEAQDVLIYMLKGIAKLAYPAFKAGKINEDLNHFVMKSLFATMTNVNFDKDKVKDLIQEAVQHREVAKKLYSDSCKAKGETPGKYCEYVLFEPSNDEKKLLEQAEKISILTRMESLGRDITGLQEMLTYGLKGLSAYADHAFVLCKEDMKVYEFLLEALNYLGQPNPSIDDLFNMNMKCGEINFKVMDMLEKANIQKFGIPQPTKVRITPIKGKCILVSGHDLKDLGSILEQTKGKGINVYTHGEMLPCNAYPKLKKYKHLIGNYGGAWQEQRKEFADFPGPIVMTTNCIQNPVGYEDRIFTCGVVQWPGVEHIENQNFSKVIDKALSMEGFKKDEVEKSITIGFSQYAVLDVSDKIVDLVNKGKIKHFFFIGGCDGAEIGRNYFTEFADNVPKDCMILTAGCGKYRFNKKEFGEIEGIPRLLDMGQCNDSYSAIQIAIALTNAFKCDVNELPLSLIVSWFEQKAVAILLTLLYLGIKDIRLGPSLPAFITPPVLEVLVNKFNIMPTGDAKQDLKTILN